MSGVRSAAATAVLTVGVLVAGTVVAVPAASAIRTETVRIGTSVQGRPLVAIHRWAAGATKRVLVIGNMHGDEQAGLKVIERLKTRTVPANVGLWLIPSINPDGTRRQHAHQRPPGRPQPQLPALLGLLRPGHRRSTPARALPASRRRGP